MERVIKIFISLKYKYIVLYFFMAIIPLIMINIMIYQVETTKLYNITMDANLQILKGLSHSLAAFNKDANLTNEKKNFIKGFELDDDRKTLFIFNQSGKQLYSTNGSLNTKLSRNLYEKILTTATTDGDYKMSGGKILVSFHRNSTSGWLFILVSPSELVYKKVSFIKELITMIVLTALISTFSIILISFYLTSPIRKLSTNIKHMEILESDEAIVKDEIWDITVHFNKIFAQLKEQMDKQYHLEIRTNRAQFLALQSQINPHFLYNTLGTINSIAIVENIPLIAKITQSLSKMFRYNAVQQGEFVSLREEIDHINNYLNVQLIRFDGLIHKIIDIEDVILECKVVKFMLQPLVENCFVHGFKNIDKNGLIRIAGYKQDDRIIIMIEDNGSGIDEHRLNYLHEMLNDNDRSLTNHNNMGIGVLNVDRRIKLAFGKEYKISFDNLRDAGLCVKIVLPFMPLDGE